MARQVRILTFGDSLTAGYHRRGYAFHPYAPKLQALLQQEADARSTGAVHVCVDHIGLSGWTIEQMVNHADMQVCTDVVDRNWEGLDVALSKAQQQQGATGQSPYNAVVILAGTNNIFDLADNAEDPERRSLHKTLGQLRQLHELCHFYGCRTVAVAVPEPGAEANYPSMKKARGELNSHLEEWASGAEQCMFVDLAAALPQEGGEVDWDFDGLHCTPAGYDKIASTVAEAAADLLLSAEAVASSQ